MNECVCFIHVDKLRNVDPKLMPSGCVRLIGVPLRSALTLIVFSVSHTISELSHVGSEQSLPG